MSIDPSLPLSRRPLGLLGAAGAVLATIGAASPAAAQSIDDLLTRKKLMVGILVDLPPFGLATGNNQYEGYDPDVARLMAKYLGVDLELVAVAGPNRIPFLLANKVDMLIATFGITPERARQVAFSIPYSSLDIELLAPKATKIATMDDLKTLKVGVPRASGQDAVLTASAPAGTRIMRFEDDATNAQAMLSGQVDAIGAGVHIAQQITKMNPSAHYESKLLLRHQPNGIALRRGQADLLQWVNTFIYFVKNNGELDTLYRKWLDGPLPELPVF
jgi:polar amino acid transport system substrate-binding protein